MLGAGLQITFSWAPFSYQIDAITKTGYDYSMEKIVDSPIPRSNKFPQHLFVISAVVFNLAVSGVYLSVKWNDPRLLQIFGLVVALLAIPFAITFVVYLRNRAGKRIIISHIFILGYLGVEILFDFVLRIPFREILWLHVVYILIFYAAAFSMIGVARRINRTAGWLVIGTFLVLIACLIYQFT